MNKPSGVDFEGLIQHPQSVYSRLKHPKYYLAAPRMEVTVKFHTRQITVCDKGFFFFFLPFDHTAWHVGS